MFSGASILARPSDQPQAVLILSAGTDEFYKEGMCPEALGFEPAIHHSILPLLFSVPKHGIPYYRGGRGSGPASLLNSSTTSGSRGISLTASRGPPALAASDRLL